MAVFTAVVIAPAFFFICSWHPEHGCHTTGGQQIFIYWMNVYRKYSNIFWIYYWMNSYRKQQYFSLRTLRLREGWQYKVSQWWFSCLAVSCHTLPRSYILISVFRKLAFLLLDDFQVLTWFRVERVLQTWNLPWYPQPWLLLWECALEQAPSATVLRILKLLR